MIGFYLILSVLLSSCTGLEWKSITNDDDIQESSQYIISTKSDLLTLSIKSGRTCSPLYIKSLKNIDENSNIFKGDLLKDECLNTDLSSSVSFTMNSEEYIAIYSTDKVNKKNHLWIYSIKNNTLEEQSYPKTPYPYLTHYSIVNYNNLYLYIFGGLNYNNDISSKLYTINLITYELREITFINRNQFLPRYDHNAVLYCETTNTNCAMIIYGGLCLDTSDRELLMSDLWEYKINENEWIEITPDNIRFSRSNGDSIIYNNEYYIYYGGYYSNGAKEHGYSDKILVTSLKSDKYEWFELDVSNSFKRCFNSITIKDNVIYSYGGKSKYGSVLTENNLLILKLDSFPLKDAESDFSNKKSMTIIVIIIVILIVLMLVGLLVIIFCKRNKTTTRHHLSSSTSSRTGRVVRSNRGESIEIDLNSEDEEENSNDDSDQFWGVLTHRIVLPPLHAIKKEEIKKLPYVIYDKSKHPQLNECPICLDLYKEGDKIVLLDCKHFYHLACMQRWFEENNVCPLCKKAYNDKDNKTKE